MHGRLKVKTTEEQQKAKQEERAKKLKLYTAATARAFQKRKDGELDTELLEITGQVLQANPDFYTFWNMRKETFLRLHDTMETDELQKSYNRELDFLEMCLKVNPKSYGTWHHRTFVLDHMPRPDWHRELELCNLFLQFDERNFHCWDYRRFVVKRSEVPASEEFDFTTAKISSNFSNFSSWHYRSKLLPILHPDTSQPLGIAHAVTESEFELVQNGLYTDPDDQSNWFYHKWLLGRGEQKQQINYIYISCDQKKILLSFTKSLKIGVASCQVLLNKAEVEVRWSNQNGTSAFSTLWVGEVEGAELDSLQQGDQDRQVDFQVTQGGTQVCQHSLLIPGGRKEAVFRWSTPDISACFRQDVSGVDKAALSRELDTISELQEVENTNKWAMLTMVLLMKAVDPVSHQGRVVSFLQQLQSLDVPRNSYYCDLRSRFIVETAIETSEDPTTLTLKGQQLSTMYRTEMLPLLQELDLSNNALTRTPRFSFLQSLQRLNLSNNHLTGCRGLGRLPCLTSLDLSNNSIPTADKVQPLQSCALLTALDVSGNPLCDDPCASDKLTEILPSVQTRVSANDSGNDSKP